jgi:hypothetical protein
MHALYEEKGRVGGFGVGSYWSSSQVGESGAWVQNFSSGNQYDYGKDLSLGVRPVRAF